MNELWQPVLGWEGLYEVSDQGNVRSLDRLVKTQFGRTRLARGRVLKPKVIDTAGLKGRRSLNSIYYQFCLQKVGRKKEFRNAHRMVCEAFHGPCPVEGWHACHGIKGCHVNVAGNVYWGSPSQNMEDRDRDGNTCRGTKHHCCRWSEDQVLEIRRRYKAGERQVDLAKEYGCSQGQISNLIHRGWKHLH